MMINLGRSSEPAIAAETRATPAKPSLPAPVLEPGPPPASLPAEQPSASPVPTAREPNPEALLADPPPPASTPKPAAPPQPPNPEARQLPVTAPPPTPAVAPNPSLATPSAEAPSPPAASNPALVVAAAPTTSAAPPIAPAPEENPEPVANSFKEAAWLKARDPRRYTVQIYSGKDLNKLKEIAAAIGVTDPVAYFTTTSRSGPWYSLVVGDYADSAAAQAAAAKVTARSPAIKPWVRRFDEVQAKLR